MHVKVLAPVGGKEQLIAAVRSGADEIYLGTKSFNARRNAENFGNESLSDAVAYCHERGVSVCVTLNTIVTDDELELLSNEVDDIASSGADAVIVQDFAVYKLIKGRYPSLPLHASTQMTVHNLEGVRAVERLGFSRVVLARELSLDEIKSIRMGSNVELEAFVHGALCMSVSGACYLSSIIGTRSGNRGMCAQPCRTNFKSGNREYALSLKDMSFVTRVSELVEAGVTSLKIEGRMKRPEYVAAAVTACKSALRGEKPDMESLKAVFSRSGFTDGYLTGKRGFDMFGYRTKEDVVSSGAVIKKLVSLYNVERQSVNVEMSLDLKLGEPSSLLASDGVNEVLVKGEVPSEAVNAPLSYESVYKNMAQTGGTPYLLTDLKANIGEKAILSVSSQKQLRRNALASLSELRRKPIVYKREDVSLCVGEKHTADETKIRVRFQNAEQMFDDERIDTYIFPMKNDENNGNVFRNLFRKYGKKLFCEIPSLCFPEDEEKIKKKILELKEIGITDMVVGNIGLALFCIENGICVHGDYGLNILNSISLEEYSSLGIADAVLSFELSMGKIRAICGATKRGIIGYGYLPLMKLRACPLKSESGCGKCNGKNTLIDSKNEKFFALCAERKYTELLNGVPLYIGDKIKGKQTNSDFVVLRYTTETREEAKRIFDMFLSGDAPDFRHTTGLYYRTLL